MFQVIRIPETSEETFSTLLEFGKNLGKATVNCKVSLIILRRNHVGLCTLAARLILLNKNSYGTLVREK